MRYVFVRRAVHIDTDIRTASHIEITRTHDNRAAAWQFTLLYHNLRCSHEDPKPNPNPKADHIHNLYSYFVCSRFITTFPVQAQQFTMSL